ncbi:MAG: MaoC family dehydratase [Desulfomonilia bacterium]
MLPEIGTKYSFRKTFSESDVYLFGGITCDSSPWHIDEIYAANSVFKKRLVYGMLTGSLFGTIIGRYFQGYMYLGQEVTFTKPVFIGDTIEIQTVVREIDEKQRVSLQGVCYNQDGEKVLVGKAVIKKL